MTEREQSGHVEKRSFANWVSTSVMCRTTATCDCGDGRRWRQGFIAIMPAGLFFVATRGTGPTLESTGKAAGLLFEHIAGYRGFTKIATADLFVVMDDGRRLRFNGGKTFALLCGRALTAAGIASLR